MQTQDKEANRDGVIFEVEGLCVEAGGVPLLCGVSLRLRRGECVALKGPSGCGKSTLLRTLALLQDPTAGTITLHGREPDVPPVFRRQVLYVQQVPSLRSGTVAENLRLPFRYAHAQGQAFPEERARAWLEELGVGAARMDQPARTLSQGQRQRVALIRAALLEPVVWLLDEPTSALDPGAVEGVETWLRARLAERACAMLVVSHDAAQGERLCVRVVDVAPFTCPHGTAEENATCPTETTAPEVGAERETASLCRR